jgi:iron complex outermembrane receptor protein
LKLELKSEIVLRQNQFPDNNFTTNIVVNNEVVPFWSTLVRLHQGINCCTLFEMNFRTFGKTNATVAFSIQNILNTNYRDYLNRQRFFADEMGRNFQIQ